MTLKNSSGFTLVEVVIALGISSVVILGAGGFLKTNLSFSSNTNARIDKNEYFDEMSKTISNRITCGETLKNLTVGSSVNKIQKKGVELFTVGQSLTKNTTLSSIKIEQNPNWIPSANKYGPARLKVEVATGGVKQTKYFPISIQLDSDKKIIGCSQKLELGNVNEDMYNEVCTSVVGGSINGKKCYWSKPVVTIVTYIPAPAPTPVGGGNACYGPVCDLYLTVLGRYPDYGGKLYWEEELARTGSIESVTNHIKQSDEALGRITFDKDYAAGYESSVNKRGLTLEQSRQQCGLTTSC